MPPVASPGKGTRLTSSKTFLQPFLPGIRKKLSSIMSSLVIVNIKLLVNTRAQTALLRGAALAELPCIENGWLLIEDSEIVSYGSMPDMPPAVRRLVGANQPGPE